jgi:hypothetical protein
MSLSPTVFSGSGPVDLPPDPWTEKAIEREVGRANDLSAPRYVEISVCELYLIFYGYRRQYGFEAGTSEHYGKYLNHES